jgi:hypothetical protein
MIKSLFLSLFLLISLSARENPFSSQKQIQEPKFVMPKIEIAKPIKVTPKKIKPIPIPLAKTIPVAKSIPIAKTIPIKRKKPKYILVKPNIHKSKKKRVKKRYKKAFKQKLLYNGKFTKIKLVKNGIKIITKDLMLQHLKLNYPTRLVVDFERFDVVGPFSKKVYTKKVKRLTIGHHDYFYRTIFELSKNRNYKIRKKPYGYLITLY